MKISIKVPADRDYTDQIINTIETFLEEFHWGKKEIHRICIVAEEIFVNIASYAYPDKNGMTEFRMQLLKNGTRVQLMFLDSGIPYNPLKRDDPDIHVPAEERIPGGLGIYMTKKMMDQVEYQYDEQKHMNILMIQKEKSENPAIDKEY